MFVRFFFKDVKEKKNMSEHEEVEQMLKRKKSRMNVAVRISGNKRRGKVGERIKSSVSSR